MTSIRRFLNVELIFVLIVQQSGSSMSFSTGLKSGARVEQTFSTAAKSSASSSFMSTQSQGQFMSAQSGKRRLDPDKMSSETNDTFFKFQPHHQLSSTRASASRYPMDFKHRTRHPRTSTNSNIMNKES